MKKVISAVLALILAVTVFQSTAFAQEAFQSGDFVFTVSGSKATIIRYTGQGGAITIPDTLGGYTVVCISDGVFWNNTTVTAVTIPACITEIGTMAFSGCSNLADVTIPVSVDSIGISAFEGTYWLDHYTGSFVIVGNHILIKYKGTSAGATIPSGVIQIDDGAFYNCKTLKTVSIPATVTYIGYSSFSSCTGLTAVAIPGSVTEIGACAFFGCTALANVTIPSGVKTIGAEAFYNTPWLNKQTGPFVVAGNHILIRYKGSASTVAIPNGILSITFGAFENCSATALSIPGSVVKIEDSALTDCRKLTSITVATGNPAYSSRSGVLFNKKQTTLIQFPCGKSGSYAIPYGVKIIGTTAFYDCEKLTGVTIPGSTTEIGKDAFKNCCFTSVVLPNSVAVIGGGAFTGCSNLTSITFPGSVKSIGFCAFLYCSNLKAAYFLGNAPAMDDYVFDACAATFKVYYISGKSGFTNPWHDYTTAAYVKKVTSLKLNAAALNIVLGKSGQLAAAASPVNATNQTVSWKSSNTAVATVDSAGKVTAKAFGTATITCTANDGSGVKATCTVKVIPATPVNVKAVKASTTSIKLTWDAVSGATGYYVYRAASKTGTYTKVKTQTSTAYPNSGLSKGHTYYYKIQAYKTMGSTTYTSGYSSIVYASL